MAKKTEIPAEIFGKPVVTTADKDCTYHKVSRSDFNDILDSKGVTKQVRETIAAANEEIHSEAIKFVGAHAIASGANQEMTLGAGNDSHTVRVKVSSEVTVPNSEKGGPVGKKTIYGQTSISIKTAIPSAMREEVINPIAEQLEAKWGKK